MSTEHSMPQNTNQFPFQERFQWYQINDFLHKFSKRSKDLQHRIGDEVHIGGIALFYRLYQNFGPSAVTHFRGTQDIDVVSVTGEGKVKVLMDQLKFTPSSGILDYSVRPSYGLPDKKSITVNFDSKKNPGGLNTFEVDLYESPTGKVRFNDRIMNKDRIVLDPPQKLEIKGYDGLIVVPSLRDGFIIKTDILDYSVKGFRKKDQLDVLATLTICQKVNCDFEELVRAMVGLSSRQSALKKLKALEELFLSSAQRGGMPVNNPFMPTERDLFREIKKIRRVYDEIERSKIPDNPHLGAA